MPEWKTSLSSCSRGRSYSSRLSSSGSHTVDLTSLRAVLRDVAYFAASVAGFASFAIHCTAVRRSTVPGDMAELAASIALHGLRLAIASKMVGSAAFVASRRTRIAAVASAHAATAAERAASSAGAVALFV